MECRAGDQSRTVGIMNITSTGSSVMAWYLDRNQTVFPGNVTYYLVCTTHFLCSSNKLLASKCRYNFVNLAGCRYKFAITLF